MIKQQKRGPGGENEKNILRPHLISHEELPQDVSYSSVAKVLCWKVCHDIFGSRNYRPRSICFASGVVNWGGIYSVAIRPKHEEGRGSL